MEKIDEELYQKLAADPEQSVALIVRTRGDPTPYLSRLAELGMQVGHQFRLVPGVSVTGQGASALLLLDEEWVVKIEEDRPVKTMPA
ncbi:MAG: hypothetical protein Kow0063_23000 [Anaerolineae bacterium]